VQFIKRLPKIILSEKYRLSRDISKIETHKAANMRLATKIKGLKILELNGIKIE
jgi:hypothetical protein